MRWILVVGCRERPAGDPRPGLDVVRVAGRRAVQDREVPAQRGCRQRSVLRVRRRSAERDRVTDLPGQRGGGAGDHRDGRIVAGADQLRRCLTRAVDVGHLQPDVDVPRGVVGVGRRHAGRVVIDAVAVEIPRIGQCEALGIGGAARVEGHVQWRRAARRGCGERGGRRLVAGDPADPPDRAAHEVDIEQGAVRADGQVDGTRRGLDEWLARRGVGLSVGALGDVPDAVAAVVREEERPVERGREHAP